jgi:C4-dicarboxylate transporter, DctM subunit
MFIVLAVELAQITPPVGFNLFVPHGMAGLEIGRISRVTQHFFSLMITSIALICLFSKIVIVLPQQMRHQELTAKAAVSSAVAPLWRPLE